MNKNTDKTKIDLFGVTSGKIEWVGGKIAPKSFFTRGYASPDSVVKIFCSGCGMEFDPTKEGLDICSNDQEMKKIILENPEKYYIEMNTCQFCIDSYSNLNPNKKYEDYKTELKLIP